MADRVVTWKALADFSKVRKEAAETQASLAALQAQTDKTTLSNRSLGDSGEKLAAKEKSSNASIAQSLVTSNRQRDLENKQMQAHEVFQRRAQALATQDLGLTQKRIASKKLEGVEDAKKALAVAAALRASQAMQAAHNQEAITANSLSNAKARVVKAEENYRKAVEYSNEAAVKAGAALADYGSESREAASAVAEYEKSERLASEAKNASESASRRLTSAHLNHEASLTRVTSATTRFESAQQRAAAAMNAAAGDGGKFGNTLDSLASGFDNFAKGAGNASSVLGLLKFVGIAGSIFELVSALSALISGLFALTSAIAPAVGGLAAIGPTAIAGLSALAALKLAFSGVGVALKAYSTVQARSGVTAAQVANQQIQSAQAIANAQLQVKNAQEQVGITARDVAANIAGAEHTIQEAQYATTQSQIALTTARKDALQNIIALKQAVVDAALAERGASLSLQDAELNLRKVMNDPNSTKLQREQAQLAVDNAKNQVAVQKTAGDQAKTAADKASKAGVEGSLSVIQAKHSEANAVYSLQQASQNYTKAVVDGARQNRQAQQSLAQAIQSLGNAERAASLNAMTNAQAHNAFTDAMNKLSPAARAFVQQLIGMKAAWSQLKESAASGLLPGVGQMLTRLKSDFPLINNLISGSAKEMGKLAIETGNMLTNSKWQDALGKFGKSNVIILDNVGHSLGFLLDLFRAISVAAIPLTEKLTKGFKDWVGGMDKAANSASGMAKMTKFFEHSYVVLHQLGQILKNIVDGLFNTGKAGTQSGQSMLDSIQRITERWDKWTKTVGGQNTMKKYFDDVRTNVAAIMELLGKLSRAFIQLGANKSLAPILDAINNKLLPALAGLFKGFSGAKAGSGIGDIIANIATALGMLAGHGSTIHLIIGIIDELSKGLLWFLQFPGVADAILAIGAAFATFKVLQIGAEVTKIAALTRAVSSFAKGAGAAGAAAEGSASFMQKVSGGIGRIGVSDKAVSEARAAGLPDPVNGLMGGLRKARGLASKAGTAASSAKDSVLLRGMYAKDAISSGLSNAGSAIGSGASRVGSAARRVGGLARRTPPSLDDLTRRIMGHTDDLLGNGGAAEGEASRAAKLLSGAKGVGSKLASKSGALATGAKDAFSAIGPKTLEMVGKVGPAFGKMASSVSGAMKAIGVAMMANPWILIIGAVIAIIILMVTHWKQTKEILLAIWNAISAAAITVWNSIVGVFKTVINWISQNWPLLLGILTGPFGLATVWIVQNWNTILGFLKTIWSAISAAAIFVFDAIKAYFVLVFNAYKTIILTAWNLILTAVTAVLNGIKTVIKAVMGWIATFLIAEWNGIKNTAVILWTGIVTVISNVWNGLIGALRDTWSTISGWFNDIWSGLKSSAKSAWDGIVGTITNAFSGLTAGLGRVWDGIKVAFTNALNFVGDHIVNPFINAINSVLDKLPGSLKVPTMPHFADGGVVGSDIGNSGRGTAGFAAGGVLPGYTPGRDPHIFTSPTGGQIHLSGGEGILVPEAVRALGGKTAIQSINHHLSNGRVGMQGMAPGGNHFSLGGVLGGAWNGARSALGAVAGGVRNVAAWSSKEALNAAEGPLRALINALPVQYVKALTSNSFDKINEGVFNFVKGAKAKQAATTGDMSVSGPQNSIGLNAGQMSNAAIISRTAKTMGATPRDTEIAFMTGFVESSIRNLANPNVPESMTLPHQGTGTDHDSVGIYQQRNSWGSAADRLNPATTTRLFLNRLLGLGNSRLGMTMGQAAQTVQVSAFPDRYAAFQNQAVSLYDQLNPANAATGVGGGRTKNAFANGGVVQKFNQGGIVNGIGPGGINNAIAALRFQSGDASPTAAWSSDLTASIKNRMRGVDDHTGITNTSAGPRTANAMAPYDGRIGSFIKWLSAYRVKNYPLAASYWQNSLGPIQAFQANPAAFTQHKWPQGYNPVPMIQGEIKSDESWVDSLRATMGMKKTGKLWTPDMQDPADHLMLHAVGQAHPSDLVHPWAGPVTLAEQALADSDRSNALNKEWYGDLQILANWGLPDLVQHLMDQGIADGLDLARSAVKSKDVATQLNASYHAAQTGFGGLNQSDEATVLKIIAKISQGTSAAPFGLRDVSSFLQMPDYGVVNLYDRMKPQIDAIPANLTTKFNNDVKSFRQGLFYAATGGQVPGTGHGDTVPAMLTPGEFVLKKKAVEALGLGTVRAANNADKAPSGTQFFANGGVVLGPSAPQTPQLGAGALAGPDARSAVVKGKVGGGGNTYITNLETEINNPVGENSVYSMNKELQRKAITGQFNRAAAVHGDD